MIGTNCITPNILIPGRSASTPRKPVTEQPKRKPCKYVAVLVREGERAIPVQPMYEDLPDNEEGGI